MTDLQIQIKEMKNTAEDFRYCEKDNIMYAFDFILDEIFKRFGKHDNIYLKTRQSIKKIIYGE